MLFHSSPPEHVILEKGFTGCTLAHSIMLPLSFLTYFLLERRTDNDKNEQTEIQYSPGDFGFIRALCHFIVHLLFVTFHLSQTMMTVQGVFHKKQAFFFLRSGAMFYPNI